MILPSHTRRGGLCPEISATSRAGRARREVCGHGSPQRCISSQTGMISRASLHPKVLQDGRVMMTTVNEKRHSASQEFMVWLVGNWWLSMDG